MSPTALTTASYLRIDPAATAQAVEFVIREIVLGKLRRKGAVIGISGGIDSSVVAALCVHALGSNRVLGVLMPERECSDESRRLGNVLAEFLGIRTVLEDITPVLDGGGCYRRRDDAILKLVPEFSAGYQCKLVIPGLATGARYPLPALVIASPDGALQKIRLTSEVYLEIVAATNFKQRVRKMLEYHHADRMQYAVAGTPNRLEYDQGFFVRNGDGAADFKPIAHLYKSQVHQLAEYLDLPREIQERPSTTDTFPMPQSQEEFYFSVPLRALDLCLYGKNHGFSPEKIAEMTGLPIADVMAVLNSIDAKRKATAYLHHAPLLVEDVPEVAQSR
jgi:NAD+ synthase